MKKTFLKYFLMAVLVVALLSCYIYYSIMIWKPPLAGNIRMITLGLRFIFPLLITLAVFTSHSMYRTRRNIVSLLLGWGLIIIGGIVALYSAVMNQPTYLIILGMLLAVIVVDIILRGGIAGIAYFLSYRKRFNTQKSTRLTKNLPISIFSYYLILFCLHILVVAFCFH